MSNESDVYKDCPSSRYQSFTTPLPSSQTKTPMTATAPINTLQTAPDRPCRMTPALVAAMFGHRDPFDKVDAGTRTLGSPPSDVTFNAPLLSAYTTPHVSRSTTVSLFLNSFAEAGIVHEVCVEVAFDPALVRSVSRGGFEMARADADCWAMNW